MSVSPSDNLTRKLAHALQIVEVDGGWDGHYASNRLVAEELETGVIPEPAGYASIRREVNHGVACRIDFLLEVPDRPPCWLEVKNSNFKRSGRLAEFPD